MTLSLNTPERIGALILLKTITHASRSEWRMFKRATAALEFTDEEKAELKMQQNPQTGQLFWNTEEGKKEKSIEVEDAVIDMLCKRMVDLDKAKKLSSDVFPLAEKLLPEQEA